MQCSQPRGVSRLCLLSEAGEQELVSDPVIGTQSQHFFPRYLRNGVRWEIRGGRRGFGERVGVGEGEGEITIVAEIPG